MHIRLTSYAPGLRHRPHGHDHCTFSMVLAGSVWERVGNHETNAVPLSIVVKPTDTVHENRFDNVGATLLQIALTNEESAKLCADPSAASLPCWRWNTAGQGARLFLKLARAVYERDVEHVESVAWDTLGALAMAPVPSGYRHPPAWLEDVRQILDDDSVVPSLRTLAEAAGVHPVYLARRFRSSYGRSITGYAHLSRVRRAAGLVATDKSLARIAVSTGFTDQSHFGRIFRRELGFSPGAYRSFVRRGFDCSRLGPNGEVSCSGEL